MTSSSVQKKDRDGGNNAQRDEDEERDPHANREAVAKRGLTGWDSHQPREPFVGVSFEEAVAEFTPKRLAIRHALECLLERGVSQAVVDEVLSILDKAPEPRTSTNGDKSASGMTSRNSGDRHA